ncbi:PAS domain-containing sensor histidine kinase [Denitratisoma sp. DHT3]|uniref:sensor histidine kinase n=1 Tax=Denitratisoma sp. DHT3 TaxID=1981880 RepID=UPI001198BBB1|nr:ATP-binding protein [Denitratisoma sp. DHT3]QDX81937.1 PAS domain-containing sensor histidine kinase [Denitratisoma sp. DHT3]
MRVLAIVATAAAAILLFLLSAASANTDLFARHYPLLLGINGAVALALLVLVGVQLRQLWRELKSGVFGSRLKSRLLGMLALMAVLPGVLVYGVSMQFAVTSIESWFDVRVDSALDGGLNLARAVLDTQQAELLQRGRTMALDLGEHPTNQRLNRLREQAGVGSATLIGTNGQVLLSSSGDIGSLIPPLPSLSQLRQARGSQGQSWLEGDAENGFILYALAPVLGNDFGEEPMLQLTQKVSRNITRSAASVEAAYRDYQSLQLGRGGLKRIYTLTLTLTLLLGLFAAVALAFFLARRLAEPLAILAEGTQAVAAGDFTPRATLTTRDELGVLTQSFSRMTQQLDEARQDTERHRRELESARTYLESVLANLSAGVLAFDAKFRLRAANRGAINILGDNLAKFEELPLDQWPRQQVFAKAVQAGFEQGATEWQQQLELESAQGVPQTLLMRGSTLPIRGGYVVVFDDISQLISAQRSAAWGEVARRLAHEIKNPLTPIQLSAERLQRKLADKLENGEREMLDRATRTIVNQVEAMKNMVNDFRDYARLPPPVLAAVDLNALIEDMLPLYEAGRMRIATRLTADLPPVLADANQLRQVIHNLLANAQDALTEVEKPQATLVTGVEAGRVLLGVSDNGPGFPPQTLARAFEPYVTSKAKGTGLGLAIVKKIVDEHHGEIRLQNPEGGGAEVTLKLPLAA